MDNRSAYAREVERHGRWRVFGIIGFSFLIIGIGSLVPAEFINLPGMAGTGWILAMIGFILAVIYALMQKPRTTRNTISIILQCAACIVLALPFLVTIMPNNSLVTQRINDYYGIIRHYFTSSYINPYRRLTVSSSFS